MRFGLGAMLLGRFGDPMLISVVVPCYNEELVIKETISRLQKFAESERDYEFELLFVDDGSRDQTLEILHAEAKNDATIRVVSFTRNFGHQVAVSAGIDIALGSAIVIIDADLQDPVEVISEMLSAWRNGFEIVYGQRIARRGETRFKRATAFVFYRLLNKFSEVEIPKDVGDFRLIDRRVAETLKGMPERDKFLRGMISWTGYKSKAVEYSRNERWAGETKYPLRKMIRFAADGILSFSTKPLYFVVWSGSLLAVLSMLASFWFVILKILVNDAVPGWTALIFVMLFLGGTQLLAIGLVGLYVGRIFSEAKQRPHYLINSDSKNGNL